MLGVADANEFVTDCRVFPHAELCRVQRPLDCAPALGQRWLRGGWPAAGSQGGDAEHAWRR